MGVLKPRNQSSNSNGNSNLRLLLEAQIQCLLLFNYYLFFKKNFSFFKQRIFLDNYLVWIAPGNHSASIIVSEYPSRNIQKYSQLVICCIFSSHNICRVFANQEMVPKKETLEINKAASFQQVSGGLVGR